MENEIRINSGITDCLDTVKSLIYSGYEVNVRAVYEEFPREKYVDYFRIIYTN